MDGLGDVETPNPWFGHGLRYESALPSKPRAVAAMCARPTVTFVGLEEIRASTLSYGMVYEGLSVIRHGVVGNGREHHKSFFRAHAKLISEHSVSNLCWDHK